MAEEKTEQKRDPVVRVLLSTFRVLLLLGLFLYLAYHLTGGVAVEMRTETVKPAFEELRLDTVGTIVRDETVVYSDLSGVVSYRFADGERVAIRSKVATVYSGNTDAETVARIAELDRSIDLLEAANIEENTTVSDGTAADRTVKTTLASVSELLSRGKYGSTAAATDTLLTATVRRDTILADGGSAAGERLAELRAERAALAEQLGGSTAVYAAEAGYFYAHADGGETAFAYDGVLTMSAAEYRVKTNAITAPQANAIGKIVRVPRWYLLCPIPREEGKSLRVGKNYPVDFGAEGMRLSMRLAAKNEGDGETLLVFTSQEMPAEFGFDRTCKVSVVTETVEGYRIPASALRVVDGVVGVYIRSGNTVRFRAAEVFYENGSYVFVDANTEGVTLYANDDDPDNDLYCKGLSLYDAVIVSGAKDLLPEGIVK